MKAYAPLFLLTTLIHTKFRINLKTLVLKTFPLLMRSSLFLGVVASVFPLLVCMNSKVGNHSGPLYFLLPFISAFLGIIIEKPHRRRELAVYVANQAIELLYRMGTSRGFLPEIKNGREILFTVSFAILVYFHRHHRKVLANSVNQLLKVIVGVESEMDFLEERVSKIYFWYKNKFPRSLGFIFSEDENTAPNTRKCKHSYGCKTYAVVGFLKAFLLGFFVKTSFVFLPALLLGPHKILSNFSKLVSKVLVKSTLQFSLFWGIMSGGPRGTECFLRWIRGTDDGINSLLAGFVGGLSVVFFSSIDVAMYIASKAAESLFNELVERNVMKPVNHGEVLLFSLSTAALFYASAYEPHNLRRSYFSWLMKFSEGHWAHFYKAFTPVRLEAGVPDITAYNKWEKEFANEVISKYITPQQMAQHYS
uniref:Transmembrane protein 135 N-terminal domain-containing protein n=1 Tax=Arcella intermedia TaxID=1963864 RepID=A0A6B2L3R6_9EUKA